MKNITINGKEYKFEYSIEASLYEDCAGCLMDFFIGAGMAEGAATSGNAKDAAETLKGTLISIPQRTLTLFHAGLLENYGFSKEESKDLLKSYIKESKKSYTEIMNELIGIVGDDNFFELIGLDKILTKESNTKPKKKKEAGENTSTEQ